MTAKTFTDLGIVPPLVEALSEQNIQNPFPIQELAIPMALQGADVIGQARTGTGKTFAFGLPLLQRIDPDRDQTQVLIVTPTRELCLQVAGDLEIGERLGLRIQTVYGGVGYDEQIAALTSGVHIVVGTPGRLLDHLGRGNLDLSEVSELVLDEADEMLDMGFLPDVERLIEPTPEDRHTMLFSATMPTEIVKLARRYMSHPTFLRADVEEHEVAPTVDQHFFLVHRMDKPRILARILQTPDRGSVYVFTRTKRMADRLVRELRDLGVKAIAVHGDLRQSTRERNMNEFRDGGTDVLVATEVAARGLDVDNATHVINYDCPQDQKMYLHRIGRTARAGGDGVAITFAEFNQVDRVNVIRRAVDAEEEIEEVFSTSDLLTERFDLPERTPWEHLGSDEQKPMRKPQPKSKSDGRPKSSRRSEGSGGRKRSPKRRDARERPTRPSERRRETEPVAVRTRTRTVDTDDQSDGDDETSRKSTRTRSRASDGGPTRSGSDSSTKGSGKKGSGKDSSRGRGAKSSGDGNGDGGMRSRSRAKRKRRRTRSDDSDAKKRTTTERTHTRTGGGPTGKTHVRTAEEPISPAAAGAPARGAGTPHLDRKIEVQHLP